MVIPVACSAAVARAAKPWDRLISSTSLEADPNKSYEISEENGPWMIMACSFSGQGADQQAKDLVLELRKKYKVPAYTYKKRFEFGKIEGTRVDRFNRPVKMKYQRGLDQVDETAVLVGNYRGVDEPEGQEVLQKIKTLQPVCLKMEEGKKTNRSLAGWRTLQQAILPDTSETKKLGPMGHAFLTTNPLLPKDYFVPKGVNAEVLELNRGIEHSLLDCPGKYTVQVAHFTGNVVIDQKEIREINAGTKEMKSQLADAAQSAHLLTKALRKAGVEAYEFHDMRSSVVTVGSFESVGTPREDGKIALTPEIYRIIQQYGSDQAATGVPTASGSIKAKAWRVEGGRSVPFDVTPIPIEVPRRSLAADYRRDILGRK
jgi:hypothetical protein